MGFFKSLLCVYMAFFTNFAYGVVSDWDKVTDQTDNYVNPNDAVAPPPQTLTQKVVSKTTTTERAIGIYSIFGIGLYLIYSILKKLL